MNQEDPQDSQEPVKQPVNHNIIGIDELHLSAKYRDYFKKIVSWVEDPNGQFGSRVQRKEMLEWLESVRVNQLIGLSEQEDITDKMKQKGAKWDGVVHAFVQGCAGRMSPWIDIEHTKLPVALRSITKKKIMLACEKQGRDYYYIDTGYFGNGKVKDYHRITKNAMQWLGPTEDRPGDRWERCGVKIKKMRSGSKILICPPSEKAMKYWNLDLGEWLDSTIQQIKENTDREIVIRTKQSRSVRVNTDTMEMALSQDIHCLVTFNSIAAVEGLINGKPVFTMGPNAAQPLANTDLTKIETPFCPDKDQVHHLMCCLAYHQFTVQEMNSGFAWAVINGQA
jgi:hypothetical protein